MARWNKGAGRPQLAREATWTSLPVTMKFLYSPCKKAPCLQESCTGDAHVCLLKEALPSFLASRDKLQHMTDPGHTRLLDPCSRYMQRAGLHVPERTECSCCNFQSNSSGIIHLFDQSHRCRSASCGSCSRCRLASMALRTNE